MNHSLEWCLEEVAIQLCRRQRQLVGMTLVHYDNKERRKVDRITFKGTKGARRDDGPGGYDCSVEIEFVTEKQVTAAAADAVMAGIESAFSQSELASAASVTVEAFRYFRVLIVNETGGDGGKENRDQQRVRTKTIPFIADTV